MKKSTVLAIVFCAVMFVVFFSTMSRSMDDEDSIYFAFALHSYDILQNHPHWFGYPLYIAIGMGFNTLLSNDLLTLTLMSSVFGAFSLLVFYVLVSKMFDERTALASLVIMGVTPMFWLESLKAMSDMVGLFFILTTLLVIYSYIKEGKSNYFLVAVALVGISTGIRIQAFFILFPALLYAAFAVKLKLKKILAASFVLTAAITIWLIPILAITGVNAYFANTNSQFDVWSRPDLSLVNIASIPNPLQFLAGRAYSFGSFFLVGSYGMDSFRFQNIAIATILFAILIFGATKFKKDTRAAFIASTLIVYLPFSFTFQPTSNPRYLIILIPLISMLAAAAIFQMKNKLLRAGVFIALLIMLITQVAPLAVDIHSFDAPLVRMAKFIAQNYSGSMMLNDGFFFEYLDYYKVNVTLLNATVCSELAPLGNRTMISLVVPENCPVAYRPIVTFDRPQRIHTKRFLLTLYEVRLVA